MARKRNHLGQSINKSVSVMLTPEQYEAVCKEVERQRVRRPHLTLSDFFRDALRTATPDFDAALEVARRGAYERSVATRTARLTHQFHTFGQDTRRAWKGELPNQADLDARAEAAWQWWQIRSKEEVDLSDYKQDCVNAWLKGFADTDSD